MLSVTGLVKSFGALRAVDGVSLTVGPGESVGLIGPNGAGKTTVFNCIGGQVRPDAGSVVFGGRDLRHVAAWRRARLGIGRTWQRLEVFSDMTVRDHLVVADRAHRREGRLWRDLCNLARPSVEETARVDAALHMVGLAEVAERPASALGLGTCRLVELARAVMAEPRLLLADEPSSGLDVGESAALARTLRRLQAERSMAVLLVEHDLAMVQAATDRVVVMDVGTVVADGSFDEVMGLPAVRRAYLGSA